MQNRWRVEAAGSGWEALERVHSGLGPDMVPLDLAQDDADSLHILQWLRSVRISL
jgi:CheY-like chemotaxis protein